MSSAVVDAVGYVQNKISNIAAGQFNSYDSFDAKNLAVAAVAAPAGPSIVVP